VLLVRAGCDCYARAATCDAQTFSGRRHRRLFVDEVLAATPIAGRPAIPFDAQRGDAAFAPHVGSGGFAAIGLDWVPKPISVPNRSAKVRWCVPGSLQTVSGGSVDDVAVGDRLVSGAEPEQRLKAGHRGAAAVMAEHELVEVDREMLG
jgi:hypothetical protein